MVLNYIWVSFFLIALLIAVLNVVITGDTSTFRAVIDATFSASRMAVLDIALPLTGIMTLWLGFMNIGEKAGAIRIMSRIVGPFFSRLFPEIPKDHPASGQLLMNFSANLLGLDNAATPMGLKAMHSLQELNPNKEVASNAQIMFLAINTSGLAIIPVSIIAQRAIMGAESPTDIVIPLLITTYISTLAAIIFVGIKQKINLFNKVFVGWILGITAFLGGLTLYLSTLPEAQMQTVSSVISNGLLLLIICGFIGGGVYKRINVYEAFIDGAKDGFTTIIKIIPFLVGMLVAIAVFRASGAMGLLIDGIAWGVASVGLPTDWVNALPTAIMRPLSGSGARALMIESMATYGADSFTGRLSGLFQGSTDTTFYIIALYFGSVGIKRIRYSVQAGLVSDFVGVIAAIFVAYLFFF